MNVSGLAATQSHPETQPSFNPDGAYNVLPSFDPEQAHDILPGFDPEQVHDLLPEDQWERSEILPLAHRVSPATPVMGTDESGRRQLFTPPSTQLAVPGAISEYLPDLFHLGKGAFNILEAVRKGKISTDELKDVAPQLTKDFAELSMMLAAPEGSMAAGAGRRSITKAFHGSPVEGLKELIPGKRGPLGPATYVSPNDLVAKRYGEHVYGVDVPDNIFNGMGARSYDSSDINPYDVWRKQRDNLVKVAGDKGPEIAAIMDKLHPSDGYPLFFDLSRIMGSQEGAQALLRKAGYTGMSAWVDGPEIAIFDKVALPGTTEESLAVGPGLRLPVTKEIAAKQAEAVANSEKYPRDLSPEGIQDHKRYLYDIKYYDHLNNRAQTNALHESFSPAAKANTIGEISKFIPDESTMVEVYDGLAESPHALRLAKAYDLTMPEAAALRYYTRYGDEFINKVLRNGVQTPRSMALQGSMNQALDKLPVLDDFTLYRAAVLTPKQFAQYAAGKKIIDPAYVSTTTNIEKAFEFMDKWRRETPGSNNIPVLYKINNKGGARYIHSLSRYPGEEEALFKPVTGFMVNQIEPGKSWSTIHMTESP